MVRGLKRCNNRVCDKLSDPTVNIDVFIFLSFFFLPLVKFHKLQMIDDPRNALD